jgi:hypothetical protein
MSTMPLDEFNRRASIALKGVSHTSTFIPSIVRQIEAGRALTPKQQQALYNVIHAYRAQITDYQIKAIAEIAAKGHDQ